MEITPIPFHAGNNRLNNGKFWYNGVENCIRKVIQKVNENQTIYLTINIDGLPIYKSSGIQFWPILGRILGFDNIRPIVIAIASGNGKPDLEKFLRPFVDEMNNLSVNGITFDSFLVKLEVKFFVCDSPARAYIKGINVNYIGLI